MPYEIPSKRDSAWSVATISQQIGCVELRQSFEIPQNLYYRKVTQQV